MKEHVIEKAFVQAKNNRIAKANEEEVGIIFRESQRVLLALHQSKKNRKALIALKKELDAVGSYKNSVGEGWKADCWFEASEIVNRYLGHDSRQTWWEYLQSL